MARSWDFRDEWCLGPDKLIELKEFVDASVESAHVAITDATVTFDAKDDIAGSAIVTGVSMPHVSNGLYRGTLADDLSVTRGQRVRIEIHANGGSGKQLERRGLLVVV